MGLGCVRRPLGCLTDPGLNPAPFPLNEARTLDVDPCSEASARGLFILGAIQSPDSGCLQSLGPCWLFAFLAAGVLQLLSVALFRWSVLRTRPRRVSIAPVSLLPSLPPVGGVSQPAGSPVLPCTPAASPPVGTETAQISSRSSGWGFSVCGAERMDV